MLEDLQIGYKLVEHSIYDKRGYPIVEVVEGYGEWVHTYEKTVQDEMDLRLLERLRKVDWSTALQVLDLACGTGRIDVWLTERFSGDIDGIDITPEMLQAAKSKGVYRALHLADVSNTRLPANSYDLCIQSLADEHLPELEPLYREASRVTKPGACFVLVGFHPQFLMTGMPTHFERTSGEPVTIHSYVHLLSDHVKAALTSGWSLLEMEEGLIDDAWLHKKPKWEVYLGLPISFVMVWQRG